MDTTAIDRIIPFMEKGKWYTCKDFPNYEAMGIRGPRKYSTVSGILSEASKNLPDVIVRRLRSREPRRNNRSIFEYSLAPSYRHGKFRALMENEGFPVPLIPYAAAIDEAYEDPEMRGVLEALKMGVKITCYNVYFDDASEEESRQRAAVLLGRIHAKFPILLHRSVRKVKVPGHRKPVFEYTLLSPPVKFYTRVSVPTQGDLDLPMQSEGREPPRAPQESPSETKESKEAKTLYLLAELKAQLRGEMEKGFAEVEEAIRQGIKK